MNCLGSSRMYSSSTHKAHVIPGTGLIVLFLVLVLAASGWGACTSGNYYVGSYITNFSGCGVYLSAICGNVQSPQTIQDGNVYYSNCSKGTAFIGMTIPIKI